jgi:hypothetical protein
MKLSGTARKHAFDSSQTFMTFDDPELPERETYGSRQRAGDKRRVPSPSLSRLLPGKHLCDFAKACLLRHLSRCFVFVDPCAEAWGRTGLQEEIDGA